MRAIELYAAESDDKIEVNLMSYKDSEETIEYLEECE